MKEGNPVGEAKILKNKTGRKKKKWKGTLKGLTKATEKKKTTKGAQA